MNAPTITIDDKVAINTLHQVAGVVVAPRKDHELIAAVIHYIEQRLAVASAKETAKEGT